jgi:uncharacterized alkaline shock family protein YloU
MHKEESSTDLGTIKIHKNVIASIASIAAIEVEGVKRVGRNPKIGFLLLTREKSLSVIKVDIDKNNEVRIEIPLIIKYGFNIPETASKVQESVRNALENMTNLSIKDIDINVQGIEK